MQDTSVMQPIRFMSRAPKAYEADRLAHAVGHGFGHISPVQSCPPPAGAGIGSTPSTCDALRARRLQEATLTTPDLHSPIEVRPMSQADVDHVMSTLSDSYFMQVDDYEHVSWLLLRGLIRQQDTHQILHALSVPRRPNVLGGYSPVMLQEAPADASQSVCVLHEAAVAILQLAIEAPPAPASRWSSNLLQLLLCPCQ